MRFLYAGKTYIYESIYMKKLFCAICFCLVCCSLYSQSNKTRIKWDYSSRKFINTGVYARVKKLASGELCMVYSQGPAIWVRKSADEGKSWQPAQMVSESNIYNYTNSELTQLQNGWLLYTWNARPRTENNYEYKIMGAVSKDGGKTWENEQSIYKAGKNFHNGCWEPVVLQLPDGEVQLYFANEAPYPDSYEQEITLLRSFDNGTLWSIPQTVSFRKGKRDGMPVPICLQNGKGIALAIEDNGIAGTFKPVIIYTENNWQGGTVRENSPKRTHALDKRYQLPDSVYAGAPYLIQLTNGKTLLSIQSSEGRKGTNEKYANIQVYTGDENARNFANPTTPFPTLLPQAHALWNSLCQINDSTVMAVSSLGGLENENGIWTVTGKIEIMK